MKRRQFLKLAAGGACIGVTAGKTYADETSNLRTGSFQRAKDIQEGGIFHTIGSLDSRVDYKSNAPHLYCIEEGQWLIVGYVKFDKHTELCLEHPDVRRGGFCTIRSPTEGTLHLKRLTKEHTGVRRIMSEILGMEDEDALIGKWINSEGMGKIPLDYTEAVNRVVKGPSLERGAYRMLSEEISPYDRLHLSEYVRATGGTTEWT